LCLRSQAATLGGMAQPGDRYEPLPALPELPRWLWRKLGRRARAAIALSVLAVAVATAALVPGLRASQQEADERARAERAEQRAELVRRLRAEQRPIAGRSEAVAAGAPAAEQLAGRARIMAHVRGAIGADARARTRRGELDGSVRRVTCEPFPRSLGSAGADEDLSRRRGRFACIAVTAEFERTSDNPGGVIGHQYRTLVDFGTGRYSFCKITGRAGPEREQIVTIPRACGGE
jgi:type II secretory pathway pseudopilin PulG